MRLVVDTNVFVSAALKAESFPGKTIRWVALHGSLLKTAATESEVLDVLQRPRLRGRIAPFFLGNVKAMLFNAELVTVTESVTACRDSNDDKFLELAVNGRADLIVSGDADLIVLNGFRGIPIVTPAAFAALHVI